MENKIIPLNFESYVAFINNSVGTNMFRNLYANIDGVKTDITNDGELSCAVFTSSILKIFGLIEDIHATVDGTVKDLEKSGWKKTSELLLGSVLVWEGITDEDGKTHKHIGFFTGNNMAISNDTFKRTPERHHLNYSDMNGEPVRKVTDIFIKPAFLRIV